MKRNEETLLIWAAVIAASTVVVLTIVYWHSMKQAIRGTVTGNYFSDDELTHSATAKRLGIDNTPDAETWSRLYALRDNVLNPARERLGHWIKVNCAYRCKEVNSAVGGVSNSQHLTGEAADITTGSVAGNRELFRVLVSLGNFDQIIWEKGGQWVHVSFKQSGNRGQMLSWNGSKYTNINSNWESAIA